ncbi:hypothetical protein ILYODFUR_011974 [Ilyodon furcidens]|uniref:Secreted protein n=1 Tax=Ilyodon furcidens TaxID=33524 RepID=A0ABV0V600_9TELE
MISEFCLSFSVLQLAGCTNHTSSLPRPTKPAFPYMSQLMLACDYLAWDFAVKKWQIKEPDRKDQQQERRGLSSPLCVFCQTREQKKLFSNQ